MVTRTVAAVQPVLTKFLRVEPLPVSRAATPKHAWMPCSTADLPLPFCPDTKVTQGLFVCGVTHAKSCCSRDNIPELELKVVMAHKVLYLHLSNVPRPLTDVFGRYAMCSAHRLQDAGKLCAAVAWRLLMLAALTNQGWLGQLGCENIQCCAFLFARSRPDEPSS